MSHNCLMLWIVSIHQGEGEGALIYIRPKKNKRFVCPFGNKIRRVGRSIFFFSKNLGVEEMQYHSCVCILGHAETQNES